MLQWIFNLFHATETRSAGYTSDFMAARASFIEGSGTVNVVVRLIGARSCRDKARDREPI